jgi:hypothetical protein
LRLTLSLFYISAFNGNIIQKYCTSTTSTEDSLIDRLNGSRAKGALFSAS